MTGEKGDKTGKGAGPATRRSLPVIQGGAAERTALQAPWPEPVLALSDEDRKQRVRAGAGAETVMLEEITSAGRRVRGFVRAVLNVPLGNPKGSVYGVFVEVDKEAYLALRQAFAQKQPTRVWGRLATRLPYLEDAYESAVCVVEDGSDLRARIVEAKSAVLIAGPAVGPHGAREQERG